jgi:hypothetical protein
MNKPLINIYKTLEEALYIQKSWMVDYCRLNSIQLLPNNDIKYIQQTATPNGGIELEDWTVYAVDLLNEKKTDITSSFFIEKINSSSDGSPQILWSLQNINFDNKFRFIYLEITQDFGATYYSNPFLITDLNKEQTSLFHYKQKRTDDYQSIQFQTWFRQNTQKTELTTYYQTSTQNTVSQAIKVNNLEIYKTNIMNVDMLIQLAEILQSPYLYVDLVRSYLFESVEIPENRANESFAEISYNLSKNKSDIFTNESQVIPTPPPTNIVVKVKPDPINIGSPFFNLDFTFDVTDGYIDLIKNDTFVKIEFTLRPSGTENDLFSDLVLVSGITYKTTSPIYQRYNSTFVVVGETKLTTTNGYNNKVLYIQYAGLTFTNTEIDNGIEKELILNIV